MFDEVISSQGLLKNKTRILVTNSVSFLPKMDYIIVMKDGHISENGTYKELLNKKGDFADYLMEHLKEANDVSDNEEDLEKLKCELEACLGKEVVEKCMCEAKSAKSVKSNISSLMSDGNDSFKTSTTSTRQRYIRRGSFRGNRGRGRGGRSGSAGKSAKK